MEVSERALDGPVTLRVTDNDEEFAIDAAEVAVENAAPSVEVGPDRQVLPGQEVVFTRLTLIQEDLYGKKTRKITFIGSIGVIRQ